LDGYETSMSPTRIIRLGFVCLSILPWMFSSMSASAATIVAGPEEAGFRAAIAAAQVGDTVMLKNQVRLQSTVVINKAITIAADPVEAWRTWFEGGFDGALLELTTNGIVFERLRFYGSAQTDALHVEGKTVTLRDCIITNCRLPVASNVEGARLRLEQVTVTYNEEGLNSRSIEATNCTFSNNMGYYGVFAHTMELNQCAIIGNFGTGLGLINGTVKNCVFRNNIAFGLWFDPDNGYLNLKGCLFYANNEGGAYLGEGGYATVDNCTFTRHTGGPAVYVSSDSHEILLRHCTVVDNVALEPDPPHWLYSGAAILARSNTRLENCLIADNPTAEDQNAANLAGDFVDGGGNVIGGPAHVSSLRDNGGPTLSLLPLSGSPAIDAGQPSDLVSDARGLSRLAGTAPDAGAIESGAGSLADTDADGIPDIWERLYGLNPEEATDAASDSDSDGQSARAEFDSGTNPTDQQSVHRTEQLLAERMSIFTPYPRWGYVTWTRRPGVFYRVEASSDLRTWSRLPDDAMPGGSTLWHNLGMIESNSPTTFYRVIATK
jgi:hypothetical protein